MAKETVTMERYLDLEAKFESMRKDNLDLLKRNEKLDKENLSLQTRLYDKPTREIEQYRQDIKKLETKLESKQASNESISMKAIKEENKKLIKLNISLQQDIINLQKQLDSKLDDLNMVSKVEYDGLVKQMEQVKLVGDQYKRLHDEIEYKYTCLKNEHEGQSTLYRGSQNTIMAMESRIKELESQDKHKTGRKRKNDISDDDIIKMSQEGKSLRTINKETGLSINTIRDILKSVSK